jgi:hypothetical protein
LHKDEEIIREGTAAFSKGWFGQSGGLLILTTRRLIWYENKAWILWPLKRTSGELRLTDIAGADQGSPLDFVGGGKRLRLHLRRGKDKCFWVERIDEWISAILGAVAPTG